MVWAVCQKGSSELIFGSTPFQQALLSHATSMLVRQVRQGETPWDFESRGRRLLVGTKVGTRAKYACEVAVLLSDRGTKNWNS